MNSVRETNIFCYIILPLDLLEKFGVDRIIVKKQPYQLLNTGLEFFPSFDASSFHKLINESS